MSDSYEIYDRTQCVLGEGPVWHPYLQELFWCDILDKRVYRRSGDELSYWSFDECVSAIGIIDRDNLLIASETALLKLNILSGSVGRIVSLEESNSLTRSNDGRADPWGGFWVGTMGKGCEEGLGAIYRWYEGELRQLFSEITIPNGTCFDLDRGFGYFSDTYKNTVWRVRLDRHSGWPIEQPCVFLDLSEEGFEPDGAVLDREGNYIVAIWNLGEIHRYSPSGDLMQRYSLGTLQTTCPAFGGQDSNDLFVTSAAEGLDHLDEEPAGVTYLIKGFGSGAQENYVRVDW